jgi:predicted nucleic acid-binding protein
MPRLSEVFLDAAYAIALAAPGDQFHAKAEELANQMGRDGSRIATTRAVLLEIGNALAKQRYRTAAMALLEALEDDPGVEIVPLTEALYSRAFEILRPRLIRFYETTTLHLSLLHERCRPVR